MKKSTSLIALLRVLLFSTASFACDCAKDKPETKNNAASNQTESAELPAANK